MTIEIIMRIMKIINMIMIRKKLFTCKEIQRNVVE